MNNSKLLTGLPWLTHGFGTRAGPLSQEGMAGLEQIHSSNVLLVDRVENPAGKGDVLVTRQPGVPVSVRTADCFPILLADTRHHAVAAVHAGWRGTAAHIVTETLRRMQTEFDTSPVDVVAAVGPGIGACCYYVGDDVARRFGREGAGYLDLAAENISQLIHAGVPVSRIEHLKACTSCDAAQFHSWRRDRNEAGRMISFIGILD